MGFFSLVIFDLILHVVWDIIEDRVLIVRNITHQNIINEATDLLIQQVEKIKPTLKEKLQSISTKNERVFKDDHGIQQ